LSGRLISECAEQHRADEGEDGAYGEYIPFQGKVHGSLPCSNTCKFIMIHPVRRSGPVVKNRAGGMPSLHVCIKLLILKQDCRIV
jgi:hypothetical protein